MIKKLLRHFWPAFSLLLVLVGLLLYPRLISTYLEEWHNHPDVVVEALAVVRQIRKPEVEWSENRRFRLRPLYEPSHDSPVQAVARVASRPDPVHVIESSPGRRLSVLDREENVLSVAEFTTQINRGVVGHQWAPTFLGGDRNALMISADTKSGHVSATRIATNEVVWRTHLDGLAGATMGSLVSVAIGDDERLIAVHMPDAGLYHFLSPSGQVLWQAPASPTSKLTWQDIDNDNTWEILEYDPLGGYRIYNDLGELLRHGDMPLSGTPAVVLLVKSPTGGMGFHVSVPHHHGLLIDLDTGERMIAPDVHHRNHDLSTRVRVIHGGYLVDHVDVTLVDIHGRVLDRIGAKWNSYWLVGGPMLDGQAPVMIMDEDTEVVSVGMLEILKAP